MRKRRRERLLPVPTKGLEDFVTSRKTNPYIDPRRYVNLLRETATRSLRARGVISVRTTSAGVDSSG